MEESVWCAPVLLDRIIFWREPQRGQLLLAFFFSFFDGAVVGILAQLIIISTFHQQRGGAKKKFFFLKSEAKALLHSINKGEVFGQNSPYKGTPKKKYKITLPALFLPSV
jgi:hypothetical protein